MSIPLLSITSFGQAGRPLNTDLENIQNRINLLIRAANGGVQTPAASTPPPPSGASGQFGPLSLLSFMSGRLVAGANFPGDHDQTIRYDGSALNYVASSFLKNTDSQVLIGNPATPATNIFQVWSASTNTTNGDAISLKTTVNAVPATLSLSTNHGTLNIGAVAAANNFHSGTAAGDMAISLRTAGHRIHLGTDLTTRADAVLDTTGLIVGSNAAAGARIDAYPTAAQIGVQVDLAALASAVAINVRNSALTSLFEVSQTGSVRGTGTIESRGNAGAGNFHAIRDSVPTTNQSAGILQFGALDSSTKYQFAQIQVIATENHTRASAQGSEMLLATTPNGSTTITSRVRITQGGDVVTNAQAALATNATVGFLWIPKCAGAFTGTPALAPAGDVALVYDSTSDRLYRADGGAGKYARFTASDPITRSMTLLTTNSTLAAEGTYVATNVGVAGTGTHTVPDTANVNDGALIRVMRSQPSTGNITLNRSSTNQIFFGNADNTSIALDGTAGKRAVTLIADKTNGRWYTAATH